MLKEKTIQIILELQKKYPEKCSALLPALHVVQAQIGYLPKKAQSEVAELFGLPDTEVHSVVSFYDMFFEEPVGKHILHVCKNISCMLRGSDNILEKVCQKLQIQPGGTTADKQFTVIASECLAACDKAPMMIADDKVIGPIQEQEIDSILEEVKKGPGHPCPVPNVEVPHG